MRIITLIENLVYKRDLYAEHGLSLYIETDNKKILFDTGQSPAFLSNAEKLGINVKKIDAVIISHGHYDHSGGLYPFLRINTNAKIYIKKEAFLPKYKDNHEFIGITYDPLLLDDRVEYVNDIFEIDKGVYIMPNIPITEIHDTSFKKFQIKKDNGFENDDFQDELFLSITRNNELSIISSCSHRGITNIVNTAIKQFNLPVNLILGGFHIKDSGANQYIAITNCLEQISPKSIGVCHCTGIEKYADLLYQCNHKVFYNFTGNEIKIS